MSESNEGSNPLSNVTKLDVRRKSTKEEVVMPCLNLPPVVPVTTTTTTVASNFQSFPMVPDYVPGGSGESSKNLRDDEDSGTRLSTEDTKQQFSEDTDSNDDGHYSDMDVDTEGSNQAAASSSSGSRSRAGPSTAGRSSLKTKMKPTAQIVPQRHSGESADDDPDYKEKRHRNNLAVKKSRAKAKQRQAEIERKCTEQLEENERLKNRLNELQQQIKLEKKKASYLTEVLEKLESNVSRPAS